MMLDTGEDDCFDKSHNYTIWYRWTKEGNRTIHQIYTPESGTITTTKGILHTFYKHYVTKYDTLLTCPDSTDTILGHIHEKLPEAAKDAFECPITEGEILHAIAHGKKKKKASGPDGICHEFYQTYWEVIRKEFTEIMNDMYSNNNLHISKKHGLLVCLPKHHRANRPQVFRPLTMLNTGLKILARIVVNRIKPWLPDILTPD
jgi:hypothetical protein